MSKQYQVDASFIILNTNLEYALSNILKFSQKHKFGFEQEIDDMQTFLAIKTIMDHFGWEVIYNARYDIVSLDLVSYFEANISHFLFKELAVYVEDGGFINVLRNNKIYRGWTFSGKRCKRLQIEPQMRNPFNQLIGFDAVAAQPMEPLRVNVERPMQWIDIDFNMAVPLDIELPHDRDVVREEFVAAPPVNDEEIPF